MKNDGRNIDKNGNESWYKNGRLHRIDGPAITLLHTDPPEYYWYKNGKEHRKNGPAIIKNNTEYWYKNGKLHRLDGPAIHYHEYPEDDKYYINDVKYSEEFFQITVFTLHKKSVNKKDYVSDQSTK